MPTDNGSKSARDGAGKSGGKSAASLQKRGDSSGSCRNAGVEISIPGWYTVKRGDNLSKIAMRFYHDADKYGRIYRANKNKLESEDLIYPCQKIYLPRRSGS